MSSFIQQIFDLLTTYPGNLAYHLVIAFSVFGAFQLAFGEWRRNQSAQAKRLLVGLALLLSLRLVFFLSAGPVWLGLANPYLLLPLIERSVNLLSLSIILWLWAFPESLRLVDTGASLIGLAISTVGVLSVFLWFELGANSSFNRSWMDIGWSLLSMGLAVAGGILLLLRQPERYGTGVAMLGVLFLGELVHLLTPVMQSNFSGATRLAHLAAYPLLFALPQRVYTSLVHTADRTPVRIYAAKDGEAEEEEAIQPSQPQFSAFELLQVYLTLVNEHNPKEICQQLTKAISQTLVADICLLVSHTKEDEQLIVQCGYDLIREEQIYGASLNQDEITLLSDAIQGAKALRISGREASSKLSAFAGALGLDHPGGLLAVPIDSSTEDTLTAVVLLSPYSNHDWTLEEQTTLENSSAGLAQVLDKVERTSEIYQESSEASQNLQSAQEQIEELRQENEELLANLDALRKESKQNQAITKNLETQISTYEEIANTLEQLQTENTLLQETIKSLNASLEAAELETEEGDQTTEQLRLNLEEIAGQKETIAQAHQQIDQLTEQLSEIPSLQEKIAELESALQAETETRTQTAEQLRLTLAEVAGQEEIIAQAHQQIDQLTEQHSETASLQEKIAELESALKAETETHAQTAEQLRLTLEEVAEQKETLSQANQKIEQLLDHHTEIPNLQGKIVDLASALKVEAEARANITEQLRTALEEDVRQEETISQANQQIDQLTERLSEIPSLQEKITAMKAELQAKVDQYDQTAEQLRMALEEVAGQKETISQANQQIEQLEERLDQKAVQMNERAKVVASMAQDLRQPLTSIVGYNDLLLGESVGTLGALQRKFLEKVVAATERMNSLLDGLAQMVTSESVIVKSIHQSIDLSEIIDEAINVTSPQIRQKNILLRVDIADNLPKLSIDSESVQQILIHLLENAGASSPDEGEILLRAQTENEQGNSDSILLQVTDGGEGIPADDLPHVFSHINLTDNQIIEGAGEAKLGLSIAKTLTEALGGSIWVESEIGQGATFNVLLPTSPYSPESNGRGGSEV